MTNGGETGLIIWAYLIVLVLWQIPW